MVDRNDCNRRVDGHERLYEIKRDTVKIPRGKGGVALEIHSTQLLRFLRCSSCSRRSFSPTWRVILWSLVGSTQPLIRLFEPLFFEITTENYNYFLGLKLSCGQKLDSSLDKKCG